MARITSRYATKSEKFENLHSSGNVMNERGDCSVVAQAVVCDQSYDDAHAALKASGRQNRRGTHHQQSVDAIVQAGFDVTQVHPDEFIRQYPGNHKNLKSVPTPHMERFNKVWRDGCTYLLFTSGHVLGVVDGENHAHTKGRARRVICLYRVHGKGKPAKSTFRKPTSDLGRFFKI